MTDPLMVLLIILIILLLAGGGWGVRSGAVVGNVANLLWTIVVIVVLVAVLRWAGVL